MFKLLKIVNARENVAPPEFYTVGSAAVVEGQALVLTSGKLVNCGASVKPEFIAMADGAAGAEIPVTRVAPNQVWEAVVSAAPTSLTVGAKVTLATDGLQVTATTTSGVVTIVDLNGATAAGDTVIVKIL